MAVDALNGRFATTRNGSARKRDPERVPLDNGHVVARGEPPAQARGERSVELDGEHRPRVLRELGRQEAGPRSDLDHEVVPADIRVPNELCGARSASEEVLAVRAAPGVAWRA